MSIKRVSSLYLPSIESLKNAHNGSLIYLDSNKGIQVTNNFSVLSGNAATFQLTASDALYITGTTGAGTAGNVNVLTNTSNGKLFVSGTFSTMNSQNFSNSENTSMIELASDLVGIDSQQISGSWIYKNSTTTEANQILRKNPNKNLNFSIQVAANSLGEERYLLTDTQTDSALANASTPDYRVMYIDDNWTNDSTKLANVTGGHSRDVYIHPDTNLVIFDSIQDFYTPQTVSKRSGGGWTSTTVSLKCRIYMPQTAEAAAYYSYTAPTAASDYIKFDASKIQFVFKRLPLIVLEYSTWQSSTYPSFRLCFEGTTSPANSVYVPFKRGIISEYREAYNPGIRYPWNYIDHNYALNPIGNPHTYYTFSAIASQVPFNHQVYYKTGQFLRWVRATTNNSTFEIKQLVGLLQNNGRGMGGILAGTYHPSFHDMHKRRNYLKYATNSLTLTFRYMGSGVYKYFIDKNL